MLTDVLGVVLLLGSGVTAGVLFAVALSVVPAMAAMPPGRYVDTHRLLGRRWDPTMPIIVLGSFLAGVALAVLAEDAATTGLHIAGAVLLLGVSAVSHLANVPINKRVKGLDPASIPDDWQDPRPVWRNWNLLRTFLAALALGVNALAVVIS
ncbi:DUF1772 domain-containing protein [Saccharopolyspora indica]|uniref:anthrone oxygenase family protein n=1 Tax=Saccharopolyspora indica TaxID=1229659 RepID=UPI0022EB5CF9|nr:DUF1772 domain-containing protein [Saccharopolyspora indica]MDA3647655.1 DUF1772 domain-containing protein [Saccharopolyspora indica]